jgi:hypothetical protein
MPTTVSQSSSHFLTLVTQGDLFDEMKRSLGRMPESQLVTSVLLPMMSALLALHAAGFIHRDIKPENTLFAANRVLKLAGRTHMCNNLVCLETSCSKCKVWGLSNTAHVAAVLPFPAIPVMAGNGKTAAMCAVLLYHSACISAAQYTMLQSCRFLPWPAMARLH